MSDNEFNIEIDENGEEGISGDGANNGGPEELDYNRLNGIQRLTDGGVIPKWAKDRKFVTLVKEKVRDVLFQFISSEQLVDRLLTDRRMIYWCVAFVPEYTDPEFNYQIFELTGDSILSVIFINYIQRKFPGKSEGYYSEMRNYYTSAEVVSRWSQFLGLDQCIYSENSEVDAFVNNGKKYTDVFEAFLGAMTYVAAMDHQSPDAVYPEHPTTGIPFTNIFMENLFAREDFGTSNPFPPRTQVPLILQVYEVYNPGTQAQSLITGPTTLIDGMYTSQISLAPDIASALESKTRQSGWEGPYVGTSRAGAKFSTRNAWGALRDRLAGAGMTMDSAQEQLRFKTLRLLEVSARSKFTNFMRDNKYSQYEIKSYHQDNGNLNQLVMTDTQGHACLIFSCIVEKDISSKKDMISVSAENRILLEGFILGLKSDKRNKFIGKNLDQLERERRNAIDENKRRLAQEALSQQRQESKKVSKVVDASRQAEPPSTSRRRKETTRESVVPESVVPESVVPESVVPESVVPQEGESVRVKQTRKKRQELPK